MSDPYRACRALKLPSQWQRFCAWLGHIELDGPPIEPQPGSGACSRGCLSSDCAHTKPRPQLPPSMVLL